MHTVEMQVEEGTLALSPASVESSQLHSQLAEIESHLSKVCMVFVQTYARILACTYVSCKTTFLCYVCLQRTSLYILGMCVCSETCFVFAHKRSCNRAYMCVCVCKYYASCVHSLTHTLSQHLVDRHKSSTYTYTY